ncbi:VOC family protein [Thalassotalea ponticola]|uniref:VOC family protein n=1 Tax=Thalassotalea ponticola TaxID=1523392 RepID=UPI0025B61CB6|nr:VOC family protein [Thalassotalea ponticola]MDN3653438.1 VOC family protein [Thalassotalea ponticola]
MQLGCFSISLAVSDLQKSKRFYQKLGFSVYAGDESHNFLIMKNGETNIGLFAGMFENNILTFNPGWDQNAQPQHPFTDIRQLCEQMQANGIEISKNDITSAQGPASFAITDPDGNVILIDQHVS